MDFSTFIMTYYKYIISACISGCFLLVNIIQAIRSNDKRKLNNAICRIPEIIRKVEELAGVYFSNSTTTTAEFKSAYKKATAESLIKNEVGDKFFIKYISVFDDAIEDILNTPAKKGGTYVQKKDSSQ